jgi:hypothetical protein
MQAGNAGSRYVGMYPNAMSLGVSHNLLDRLRCVDLVWMISPVLRELREGHADVRERLNVDNVLCTSYAQTHTHTARHTVYGE